MNKQAILNSVAAPHMKAELPEFRPGDTVRVHQKVREGDKFRIQVFEGLIIAMRNGGISESIVVRKMSNGVGVERSFPIHSPNVDKFEVIRHGKVRRAKLYYLRDRVGKAARIAERR
ncbi:MAG: 50S ribosomal protein L19 [Armatimonadetes bacterium]|nr:50S ribosomal protein L19 [Armatimonadota bacterium]